MEFFNVTLVVSDPKHDQSCPDADKPITSNDSNPGKVSRNQAIGELENRFIHLCRNQMRIQPIRWQLNYIFIGLDNN